jgi:hypothetical protein
MFSVAFLPSLKVPQKVAVTLVESFLVRAAVSTVTVTTNALFLCGSKSGGARAGRFLVIP